MDLEGNSCTCIANEWPCPGPTQEKKVCWFYTYRCAKSMSPVLTQWTCAETCTVLKLHMCCLHICAILAYEIVLLLMC